MPKKITDIKDFAERRTYKRFKVRKGIFTVLRPQVNSSKLGGIIDIGMGGLAFQYFTVKNTSYSGLNELDIYVSGDGLYVAEIPIKVVSDLDISESDPFYPTTMKRFGVMFGNLSHEKINLLKKFIKENAVGTA